MHEGEVKAWGSYTRDQWHKDDFRQANRTTYRISKRLRRHMHIDPRRCVGLVHVSAGAVVELESSDSELQTLTVTGPCCKFRIVRVL